MTLIISSLSVLMFAGMVLTSRRRGRRHEFADQTWSVEESMHSGESFESAVPEERERKIRDLSDVGYSPEAARAILESQGSQRND
jgi:hypothetical protein